MGAPQLAANIVNIRPADVLITDELTSRPRKHPDLAAEAAAFRELSALLIKSPHAAVQRFVELAAELCDAGSAGLSLLEPGPGGSHQFRWDAMAGQLAAAVGGTTPRDFSPCGLCLDAGRTVLVSRPFRAFDYFNNAARPLMEGLIVPLYDTGGAPLGTVWIVHHDATKRFDAEDARVMEQLAIQLVLALKLRREGSEAQRALQEVQSLRAEKADLADASAFLSNVLASSGDCIKVLDLEGRLIFMSEGGRGVMEIDDFSVFRNRLWPDFWDGEHKRLAWDAIHAAKTGSIGRFRGPANTAKGTPKYWDVQVTPMAGEDKKPKQLLAISRDITEQHKAEEQERLLNRELEHRIKNTLAMVSAIVNQTFRSAQSTTQAKETLLARIGALNHAHDILTRTSWRSASMTDVVEGAIAPHRTGDGRFRVTGPDLRLSARQSLSLALAINELATNAAKYGAMSNDKGHVDVTWRIEQRDGRGFFQFEWREVDGPPVQAPARRGFGSRLIERTLAGDFGAEVGIEYASNGVHCLVTAPIGNLQSEGVG